MVILDNSRTLGAFERQSGIYKILFLYLHQIINLVSEPETYPDYPSVPVNQITNKIITNLINYLPEYPWYEYIYNSNDQFDENLPELINAGNHFISLYINTDDCLIEFSTEQPDSSDNLYYSFTGIYFTVYFD